MKWLILVLGIASNASASVLIKLAMLPPRKFPAFSDSWDALTNWPFWLGLTLYGAFALCGSTRQVATECGAPRAYLRRRGNGRLALCPDLWRTDVLDDRAGYFIGDNRGGAHHVTGRLKKIMTTERSQSLQANWQVPAYDLPLWLGRLHEWCVVVPVINEGDRIKNLLKRMATLGISDQADIIIVDGGSTDGSLDLSVLQSLEVHGLLIKTGPGRLSAQLRCGYAFALEQGYAGIVTIDGNDKDDPEAIPRFIKALKDGVDFVQASRYLPGGIAENTPKIRELAIRWIHAPLLSWFSGFHWTDTTQGFRAYSRRILLDSQVAPFRDIFTGYELLAYLSYRVPKLGYRCIELPTARRYPVSGKIPTKISSVKGNLSVLQVLLRVCIGQYNP